MWLAHEDHVPKWHPVHAIPRTGTVRADVPCEELSKIGARERSKRHVAHARALCGKTNATTAEGANLCASSAGLNTTQPPVDATAPPTGASVGNATGMEMDTDEPAAGCTDDTTPLASQKKCRRCRRQSCRRCRARACAFAGARASERTRRECARPQSCAPTIACPRQRGNTCPRARVRPSGKRNYKPISLSDRARESIDEYYYPGLICLPLIY